MKNLESAFDAIKLLCNFWDKNQSITLTKVDFVDQLSNSLWANRADLSLHPNGVDHDKIKVQHEENILINDTEAIWSCVEKIQAKEVHFILDNAGLELFCDMGLADYLIRSGVASKVHFHVKAHPTYSRFPFSYFAGLCRTRW